MLKGTSIPGIIVSKALDGPIIPLLNDEIIEEYRVIYVHSDIFGIKYSPDAELVFDQTRK